MITDSIQGMAAMVLFIGITFQLCYYWGRTSSSAPPRPDELGFTEAGAQQWFILPSSLVASAFISEILWQRAWAAESKLALRKGAIFAAILSGLAVIAFGFAGWFSIWATGRDPSDPEITNVLMFRTLSSPNGGFTIFSCIGIVMAAILHQSAVDTLQTAMATTVVASMGSSFRKSMRVARCVVLVVNIPLMVIGAFRPAAPQLFLVTNLISLSLAIPLMSGLFDVKGCWISGRAMIAGFVSGLLAITISGLVVLGGGQGVVWAWWDNQYDIKVFVASVFGSLTGLFAWAAGEFLTFGKRAPLANPDSPMLPEPQLSTIPMKIAAMGFSAS
jgi:hypothetical protein